MEEWVKGERVGRRGGWRDKWRKVIESAVDQKRIKLSAVLSKVIKAKKKLEMEFKDLQTAQKRRERHRDFPFRVTPKIEFAVKKERLRRQSLINPIKL